MPTFNVQGDSTGQLKSILLQKSVEPFFIWFYEDIHIQTLKQSKPLREELSLEKYRYRQVSQYSEL